MNSYRGFFADYYDKNSRQLAWDKKECFEEWQNRTRQAVLEKFGIPELEKYTEEIGFSGSVTVEETVREEAWTGKKISMETLPGVFLKFWMLIPDGVDSAHPAKAVIAIPAHGANKESAAGIISCAEVEEKLKRNPKESYGKSFVRQGYVVFCPDPPGYGERQEKKPMEDECFAPQVKRSPLDSSCKVLQLTAEALGLSLLGLNFWDMKKLTDYALGLDIIKDKRIAAAGFSGGGAAAMWLAALDERVSLAVISGYVHGYRDTMMETHLCQCNYTGSLWKLVDICDVLSLIAPRALYVENGVRDIESGPEGIGSVRKQIDRIRPFFADEKLQFTVFDGIHEWYGGCNDFVNRNL